MIGLSMVPVSLLAASAVIWQASYAAFSATTATGTNSWTSGTVSITSDQSGTVVWNLTGVKPDSASSTLNPPGTGAFSPAAGASAGGSACVMVTYNGNMAADVRLYASTLTETGSHGGLGPFTLFDVDTGTDSGSPNLNCSNYTTDTNYRFGSSSNTTVFLGTFPTTYAGAAGGYWTPSAAGTSKWYRLSWLLPANTDGTNGQNQQVQVAFTWEARNT